MKRKKLGLILFGIAAATLCAVGLSACNSTPSGDTQQGGGEQGGDEEKTGMTFNELIANHKANAVNFFEATIRPLVVGEKQVLAETWRLDDKDGDNKVDGATISYIYKADGNLRKYAVTVVDIPNAVSAQDICDGNYQIQSTTSQTPISFEFDAKANYNHKDFTEALYNAENVDSEIKLFSELAETTNERHFNILIVNGDTVSINKYDILKNEISYSDLINQLSLHNYDVREKENTTLNGAVLKTVEYELENLGADDPVKPIDPDKPVEPVDPDKPIDPVDPDKPVEPSEPAVTDTELITALETYCQEGLLKKCFTRGTIDIANIKSDSWYLTKDSDNNIVNVEYIFIYQRTETESYIKVAKVKFSTPTSKIDIKAGNLENATYTSEYSFLYNPTIQEEHSELLNKICDTIFTTDDNTNVVRYLKIEGYGTDSTLNSMAQSFTVVEIENGILNESSIRIKESSSDKEYISKLDDKTNYRITSEKTYIITGTKLENTES